MPHTRRAWFVVCALMLGCGLSGAIAPLEAQPAIGPPVPTWAPNGAVSAVLLDGHTLYVGGSFDQVGPRTGGFAVIDPADATAVTTTAAVPFPTRRVIADGAGGWYVSTDYAFAGPTPAGVLHILSTGVQDPAWTSPTFDLNSVAALATDGGRLFVGGGFRTVNGSSRPGLAALDGTSGALLPWDPQLVVSSSTGSSPALFAMAAIQGRLYIHGYFAQAGGAVRNRFAVLDTATGSALPGTLPDVPGDLSISTILLTPTRVYLQGTCRTGGAVICAYAPDLTPLPGWTFPASGSPLALSATTLYGIEASTTGPPFGTKVVALDPDTGAYQPWTSPVALGELGYISALAVSGSTLYIGGSFAKVNGQSRYRLAAVDATSGALLPWVPIVGAEVAAIHAAAGAVAIGGKFASVGGIRKRNLVALDLRSGRPGLPTPDPGAAVTALLKLGDVMVVGGRRAFGTEDPDLTAFLAPTGALYPWSMSSNGHIRALAADGNRLYIGGNFSTLSGALRLHLAAVDLRTAALTSWTPSPDGTVFTLAVNGGALFAAGAFTSLPGYGRPGVAAFDTATGTVLSFNPRSTRTYTRGFGFYSQRVLLTGESYLNLGLVGPLDWVDRISGEVVPPANAVRLRGFAATQAGGTILVTGASETGVVQLAVIDAPSGRVQLTPIPTGYDTGAVAANADYIAVGGESPGFPTGGITLAVYQAPRAGAPQRLTAAVAGSTVTLGWQPGLDPPSMAFLVELGTTTGATDVGVFNVGLATRVAGTLPAGTYFTRVRGVGANGPGPASSEVIVTAPATATAPQTPGPLTAAVSAGVVTLSWGAAAGNATTYVIEAGTVSGVMNIGALPTGTLDTTWATPAPPGTYFVRVRAANASGLSGPTSEVTVVVP